MSNRLLKISKRILKRKYLDEKKSSTIIAKELKCDHKSILKYLKIYDIPVRTKSQAGKISMKRRPAFTAQHRQNISNSTHRHHIDLNKENNKKSNILLLSASKHRKIHLEGYRYLVETGQIKKYLKWFDKKYSLGS